MLHILRIESLVGRPPQIRSTGIERLESLFVWKDYIIPISAVIFFTKLNASIDVLGLKWGLTSGNMVKQSILVQSTTDGLRRNISELDIETCSSGEWHSLNFSDDFLVLLFGCLAWTMTIEFVSSIKRIFVGKSFYPSKNRIDLSQWEWKWQKYCNFEWKQWMLTKLERDNDLYMHVQFGSNCRVRQAILKQRYQLSFHFRCKWFVPVKSLHFQQTMFGSNKITQWTVRANSSIIHRCIGLVLIFGMMDYAMHPRSSLCYGFWSTTIFIFRGFCHFIQLMLIIAIFTTTPSSYNNSSPILTLILSYYLRKTM